MQPSCGTVDAPYIKVGVERNWKRLYIIVLQRIPLLFPAVWALPVPITEQQVEGTSVNQTGI